MRKILYSPGYGDGWSTENSGDVARYMLEYKPIIDALESGKTDITKEVEQLKADCLELFDEDYVHTLGAENLLVATVSGLVRINNFNGHETYEEPNDYEWL